MAAAATVAHAQYRPIPNYVGIGAGAQFRADINNHLSGVTPIAPRLVSLPLSQLPVEQDGQEYWCADCQQTNPCQNGGQGALALGSQKQWSCTSGAASQNGFPLSADVSASAHRIQSLAPNAAAGDALSQGQSHLNDLAAATGPYDMGLNRITNMAAGLTGGDALQFGQSGGILNGLDLNSNRITGVAAATASGNAIAYGQNNAQLTANNAAIAEVSSSEAGPSATPLSITAPASIASGNALVLIVEVNTGSATFTLPTGFTQIRLDNTGANQSQVIACKTATGSEPGSYSTSFTGGSGNTVGAIIQLSNTDCAHLEVNSGVVANSATTATIPAVTTTQSNEYLIAAGSWACGDVPGLSVGQLYINNGTNGRLVVSGYPQTAAGASPAPVVGPMNTSNCGANTVVGEQAAFIPNSTVQAVAVVANQSGGQLSTLTASVNEVLNVMAPPYNALGDGNTDDDNAIQQAVYDACGANPPTFLNTAGHKTVYLPRPPVCYMHSKPIRLPCPDLEFKGDLGTSLCQNYAGEAVIQEGWGVANLSYGSALVGSGNSLVSASGTVAESIDLARWMNGSGTNNLASKMGGAFNIAFFMKATASGGQILSSTPAYPGSGNGAFSFSYNGSNQVIGTVNLVTTGLVTVGTCAAQTLGTVYEIELDYDGTTYRLWQGTPGGTAVSCGTSANAHHLSQGVFEEIMLPDGGPHQFWPDGSSNTQNAFAGNLDSVRFEIGSVHSTAYTVPNAKFTPDNNTYMLENFETSLDGTQVGYTGFNTPVYSVVLNGAAPSVPATGNYIHDMELCSVANGSGFGHPDGIFAVWANNSRYVNLSCSNAYYSQADLFNNDYLSRVENWQGFGGHVGLAIGAAYNDGFLFDNQIDGVDVACEVNQGGGGGAYEDFHTHCIDRGSLRYGWIQNQGQAHYTYPFIDQESANTVFQTNFLLNAPFGPNIIDGGNIDTRNSAPYVLQDNGGVGGTFIGTIFNTFGQSTPAADIVEYTNGTPSSPTQLINTLNPAGVPLSNLTAWVQKIDQNAVMQNLELQQVPKFDAGLAHLTVNAIADPAAATITVVGTTGSTAHGPYFVVCHDANGGTTLTSASSNTVANGPAALSGSNYIHIAWSAVTGCNTWDVLKNNTTTSLTTGLTGTTTSFNDIGQATAAYTSPVRNTTGDIAYGSILTSAGMPFTKIPGTVINGGRFYCTDCDPPANPPTICTHSGTKTGSWVDGLNNQWLCVP